MAIWYNNNGYKRATFARENMGTDAYLYLPGPSLKYIDFDVRIAGTTAFAINTAYPKIIPHYWVGMDKPECYSPKLMFESFPKFFRGTYSRRSFKGKDVSGYPQSYFVDIAKPEHGISGMFDDNTDDKYMAWFNHTLGVVLHLMLLMGAKRIHFVGCDLGGDSDYYDDRVLTDSQREYNRRLYRNQEKFIKEFAEISKSRGVECISCTEHSPINKYMPFVPIKIALENSTSVIPSGEFKHALDVTAEENSVIAGNTDWVEPIPGRNRGVLVCCDKDAEWMLPWWHYNYSKYNDFPVQFVDLGMTKDGVDFCKARGSYTKLPDIQLKAWFKKPFALRLTQFNKTIYMDVDCETRGSLYDLFDFEGFAISKDKLNRFSTVNDPVNTGVIVYSHGNKLIDDWCDKTIKEWHKFRSDQDVLDNMPKTYSVIPHDIHWLRIMGENQRALIYHYTGPIGKQTIRDKMSCSRT